jgi:hypothetical protein
MKSQTLLQQHASTPPSAGADQPSSLHQLALYNADRNALYSDLHGPAYGSSGPLLPGGVSQQSSHLVSQPGEAFGSGIQYVSRPFLWGELANMTLGRVPTRSWLLPRWSVQRVTGKIANLC